MLLALLVATTGVVAVRVADRHEEARPRWTPRLAGQDRYDLSWETDRTVPASSGTEQSLPAESAPLRDPGAPCVVTVFDSDTGRGVPDVTLRLAFTRGVEVFVTDARGRATVARARRRVFTMGLFPDEDAPYLTRCLHVGKDAGSMRIWLQPAGWCEGLLVDDAGQRIINCTVRCESREVGSTDGFGRFRLKLATAYDHKLEVPGYRLVNPRVSAGMRGLVLRAVLRKLAVSVLMPNGSPVSNAPVRVQFRKQFWEGDTDGYGMFVADGVPPEASKVIVQAPVGVAAAGPVRADVEPGQAAITVRLRPAVAITGVVYGSDGKPAPDSLAWALPIDAEPDCSEYRNDGYPGAVDARGRFEVWVPADYQGLCDILAVPVDTSGMGPEGVASEVRPGATGVRIIIE